LVSFTRLTGTAQASIRYKDFNIAIPEVPGVADISDEVQLAIDFVAQSSDQ
jgi:predicted membrane GTPase involved in stress response